MQFMAALILDTRDFEPSDRADVVRSTIASTVVPVDIAFEGGSAAVQGAITDLGPVRVCSIRSNAVTVERTPALARDDLERCRADLSHPAAQLTPISAVARRWGFASASSFSRTFRTRYGLSPREWRDRPG